MADKLKGENKKSIRAFAWASFLADICEGGKM